MVNKSPMSPSNPTSQEIMNIRRDFKYSLHVGFKTDNKKLALILFKTKIWMVIKGFSDCNGFLSSNFNKEN